MIELETYVGLLSSSSQADLLINKVVEWLAHIVGCDQQVMEVRGDKGALDEVKDLHHVVYDALVRSHQHEVGIESSGTLVEVTRADAGDAPMLGADVDELRVDLQLLMAEDNVDTEVLHLLPPVDI